MKCADAALRAFVDNELGGADRELLQEHLLSCGKCSRRATEMANDSQQVQTWMAALALPDEDSIDSRLGYAAYQTAVANRKPATGLPTWLRAPQISAVCSALALILLLSFAPTQTWAQHFLQMLRIQKLAVVPVDVSALMHDGLTDSRTRQLSQLISDSVVVTIKPGDRVVVPDAAAAAASVGFKVETLDRLGAPQRIAVQDEGAFHMTLDSDRIRAVLEEAGRTDIQVPDSVNGSVIAVHVSKGVSMTYGSCADGKNGHRDETCTQFLQIPIPTVSVPPNLNMRAVAEAGLQLVGLSAAEASNFAQTVDWSSTLVIPIPHDKASYRSVPVDGVSGTLIDWPPAGSFRGNYVLLWLKNGVIHSVSGLGSSDRALSVVADLSS